MKRFNETYRKRQFITRNQWADTYKAIHADTEEKVILKVLVRQGDNEEYISHLSQEVDKIKNIKNNSLIHIHNMYQYSAFGKSYPYIEGEYFKGITLKEKLATTKYSKDEAMKIAIDLGEGIREFHKLNIIFNNLNLDNIYVNKKDIVKLDAMSYLENKEFNIISDENVEEDTSKNIKEEIFTPDKDIYDLGVVLYSLLSGKNTFNLGEARKYIHDKNLLFVIEKATNDKLENKYPSVDRFIDDLKSYLSCGELSLDGDIYEEEVVKPKRKKGKFKKTLGICATIAIVVGGSVYAYDLLQKNSSIKSNKTEVSNEKTTEENDKEVNKETNKDKEVKEDKTVNKADENKNNNSDKVDNNKSTGSNTYNNTINNNSSKPNVDTNKPNNDQNSGSTNTTPNEGSNNDNVVQTPEVPTNPTPTPTPTPDNPGDSSGGGDNVPSEVPQIQE